MPARKTAPRPAPPTRDPCPTCAWFSRWLVERLGFRPGERLRVVEAHRLVVILPGDAGAGDELASSDSPVWPAVLAEAGAPSPSPTKGGNHRCSPPTSTSAPGS
jgi:hypothetical protein